MPEKSLDEEAEIFKTLMDEDKHWVVRVTGVEGMWLMHRIARDCFKNLKPEDRDFVYGFMGDGSVIHWIRKSKVSASYLGKIIGQSPEKITKVKTITIASKKVPGLPEPTVAYWGTA